MKNKNNRGAMEMSVGTIVTIVLLMSVLVLGIFLIQKIFKTGTSAIDTVDAQIQSEVNKLFANTDAKLVVYPSSREITLKKGDDPKGFAFSVRNDDVESHTFEYSMEAQDVTGCGSLTEEQAESWLLPSEGEFDLGAGNSLTLAEKILFIVPSSAPPCTIAYRLKIDKESEPYEGGSIFVTVR